MAATFHVFVDGATDTSAQGLQNLAVAMSSRYGLSPNDLVARLSKGRFRVKANADKEMAAKVAADLRSIGARVTIEEATAANATTGPIPKQPAAKPAPSALPPRAAGQVTKPPATLPPPKASAPPPGSALAGMARTSAPAAQPATGLAAALASDSGNSNLGALEGAAFSLSALDGTEEAPPPIAAPPPRPGAPAPAAAPKALDMFAPPDMQEDADMAVLLAPEDEARHAAKKATKPPPPSSSPAGSSRGLALAVDEPPARPTPTSSIAPPMAPAAAAAPSPAAPSRLQIGIPAEWVPRARFAAGVLLSILLGFIPATLIGSAREHSAFKSIDQRVEKYQSEATSPEAYATIDAYRADAITRKHSERRNAALIALVIWAAAGSGIAYVWFRRIPWKTA